MRTLLMCLILVSTSVFAQEKAPPSERENLPLGASQSICDSDAYPVHLLTNCGFERGNFSGWTLGGALDYVSVATYAAHSGSYGGSFGAVGGETLLFQSFNTIPGQSYYVNYYLANLQGGRGTHFRAVWCSGPEEECVTMYELVDPIPFGWTTEYSPEEPLLARDNVSTIEFFIRHDPDYFYLDDVLIYRVTE